MSSFQYAGCLVALQGRAGAGKSTAAQRLIESFGFQRERFSAPLKDMMRAFGLNERQIEGDLIEGDLKETLCMGM